MDRKNKISCTNATSGVAIVMTEPKKEARPALPPPNEDTEEKFEHPPTSFIETLFHVFKGNVGSGLFAMGYAFRNGGIVVSPVMTLIIAILCIHCMHLLINCAGRMYELHGMNFNANYADVVEMCFATGPMCLRRFSKGTRLTVNIFICMTQFGFCCVYFIFIATNIKQVLDALNGFEINLAILMLFSYIPVLLTSLIPELKWLAPVSLVAGICMVVSLCITLVFALKDGLPDIPQRPAYTNQQQLALFFGTAIFAFEGIALVLPLKNAMRKPEDFNRPLGVLNVGMGVVSCLFIAAGWITFAKWGDETAGSITLNLGDHIAAHLAKVLVALGVLLGYALQFFIPVQIIWPPLMKKLRIENNKLMWELVFRTFLVTVTLCMAEAIPALGLIISFIGALASTTLALIIPPIIEMITFREEHKCPSIFTVVKNVFIISLGVFALFTGTWESLTQIIKRMKNRDFD